MLSGVKPPAQHPLGVGNPWVGSHVLGDRGIGDGLCRGVQAALAAQAAAVAAEAAELAPHWVVGSNAPCLRVEGVFLIDVIIVLLPAGHRGACYHQSQEQKAREGSALPPPACQVPPGTRRSTDHGGKGGGHQQGEEHQVEQPLHAIVADANESVQVVLQQWDGVGMEAWGTLEAAWLCPGPPSPCADRGSPAGL